MGRARSVLWVAGVPLRWVLLALIRTYQVTLSGWLGGQCKYYPSCSHYADQAVRAHGALKGSLMAAWRIARCGPFTDGGVDHVPPRADLRHEGYDHITRSEVSA